MTTLEWKLNPMPHRIIIRGSSIDPEIFQRVHATAQD